ncbi:hypothetical protein [Amycolatopsis sp. PS_44_ISF1]|uniref:hypothetical protein n=1 Tax=Amycolatopsis sp. PS_44_ISF1 TaxID=2974917 RepID=UPI0028DD6CC5|nr:hypothetical protein [Amycolatopsis sp. PS_44_ISF1]MDT8910074.1 tryptophan 2,3-dioxygenase [Amycolatopsis sp. PS_44_ISF1]
MTAFTGVCADIAAAQRRAGRFALTGAEREAFGRLHEEAAAEPTGENLPLRLLTRPFSPRVIPEYYRYTSLHVHEWFLADAPDPVAAAAVALHLTVADLLELERRALPRLPYLAERVELLTGLTARIGDLPATPRSRVRELPVDDARASLLLGCSGFPQSDQHEEHVFLRSVQACELVFFLVRRLARPAGSAFRLRQLGRFADLLNGIFEVLTTLTPERFLSFRAETGDASAVQSLNYHLMELVVHGHDPRRAEIFARFPHLSGLSGGPHVEVQPLRRVVAALGRPELDELCAVAERALLVWRGRHYGFARKYLPDSLGSGGTDGWAYLKRFVTKDAPPLPELDLVSFACL